MNNYRSSAPFNVPMYLYIPQTVTVKGSRKKVLPSEGALIYCSFRTFGGTEKIIDNALFVEDTAVIETWYRNDIKADCILESMNGVRYEILGTPENIQVKNMFLKFKIRAVKGGA